MSSSSSSNSNSLGSSNYPPGSVTNMQGGAPGTPIPTIVIGPNAPQAPAMTPTIVIGPNAPQAPPMTPTFADANAARLHLFTYIQAGGQLSAVPSGFRNETDQSGAIISHVYYRRQTNNERGTKAFWVKWIWPGCQDWEIHVHYGENGKPSWINFCQDRGTAYTGFNTAQETEVKRAGASNPPKDT